MWALHTVLALTGCSTGSSGPVSESGDVVLVISGRGEGEIEPCG